MMDVLADVWGSNVFNAVSMTAAIQKLPAKPGKIGKLGIFTESGVTTKYVAIDHKEHTLSLVPTRPRGGDASQSGHASRKSPVYAVPHFPVEDVVLADDYDSVREFGKASVMAGPAALINERMTIMKDRLELTLEFMRAQALQGKVYHVDNEGRPEATAAHNLFTDFDVTEQSVDFVLGTTTTKIRSKAVSALRKAESALGAVAHQGFLALCGKTFWDNFIDHTAVAAAFDRWQNGAFLRDDLRSQGFPFAGITWMEYNASIGTAVQGTAIDFFPAAECRIFPVGIPGAYITRFAPAPWLETVNTIGQRIYAKQAPMDKWNSGRSLHAEMNAINLCLYPGCLVKGHTSN